MGAVCARPPEGEEVEYFGPPDRPRNVPKDLREWKQAIVEKERQKKTAPSATQAGPAESSEHVVKSQSSDVLLTPGGSKIGKLKEETSDEQHSSSSNSKPVDAVAVI